MPGEWRGPVRGPARHALRCEKHPRSRRRRSLRRAPGSPGARRRRDSERGGPAMKFRVERDALADAVAWTAKSLPSRPSVPVLAGVLMRVADGQLQVSGFDYEVSKIGRAHV